VAKKCQLKSFELSQSYQMFWDKFEKSNYFLENVLETLEEPTDGRLIAWLMQAPVNDGGQWDMFVNLVEKYGVVPKTVMPETYHSSQSRGMNSLITSKLRQDAIALRNRYQNGERSVDVLRSHKEEMLAEIYRLLVHFLGEPPTQFDFEYRDKDNVFHADPGLTPQTFFAKHVPVDLNEYVSVINAPTADKPYGRTYTVQYLGNVKGGRDVLYLNVESETLRELALAQLQDGEVVWFGCDVGKDSDRVSGVMDTALYDYQTALGVPFHMTKAERLDYGQSQMTHAMVFTGVNLVNGRPNRWKVENSWGTEPGNKGFFVMSDSWFDEHMYQVVVQRKYLSPALQAALKSEPIQLKPWDPMGSLA
jgi:bleomycin hydrolase